MKFAVGLMACIAIAFTFITSPNSQPRASAPTRTAEVAAIESSIADLTRVIADLQASLNEQHDDIDSRVESRLVAFTESLPVPDDDEVWTAVRALEAKLESAEKRLAVLESARKVQTAAAPVARSGGSVVTASGPVVTWSGPVVSSNYVGRWHNNSGMSDRDHAVLEHGFDPSLSDAELARQHDAYHDTYGPASPSKSAVVRSSAGQSPAFRTRSTTVSSPVYGSNCPGGVCPTNRTTTVQSGGGLLGFGILGRRR